MYTKTYKTRILRIEHEVTICSGTRAVDIKESLNKVPDEARLIEAIEPDDDRVEVVLAFREDKDDSNND